MKTDKEYPATHSMSTAWYVADEEGNVAIMDYNDNGPVPWGTEQTCTEDLVLGHDEYNDSKDYLAINLTDDQVLELIGNPQDPTDDFDNWLWETVVQIDKAQEKEFLELTKNPDVELKHCLSQKLGLYMLDCYHCFVDKRDANHVHPLKTSSLYKMLASNMILKKYSPIDFYINDEWKDDHIEYEHHIKTCPYYIYYQPYWNDFLAERIITPMNPVKIDQFPQALQKRVHRVPLKFSECKQFQIAEWVPCSTSGCEGWCYDGGEYSLLPLTDGSKAYLLDCLDVIDFYDYCSEKEKYNCKKCSDHCAKCHASFFTDKPTVMKIVNPFNDISHDNCITSDPIIKSSVIMPFLPRIPKPIGDHYAFIDDVKKVVSQQMLEELCLKNWRYMENMIARYNPRVIIADKDAWKVLQKKYQIGTGIIQIKGKDYSIYKESDVEIHRGEIESIAALPYQGKVFPRIISIEEMERKGEKWHD